jgi:hypothetical protein
MEGSEFDEAGFFRAVFGSGGRCLLIGRPALIALGLPMMTRDYDFWLHAADVERFNSAAEAFGLFPNRSPAEARATGRYVLENDEHVDVMISAERTTVDGTKLAFDDAYARRREIPTGWGVSLWVPCLPDLIVTKRFAARPRDAEDVRILTALLAREKKP